jgi:hypothetical protein
MKHIIEFKHQHAAHCESGVLSSLFGHNRVGFSEAMVFGIGNGLSFAYLPFLRMGNMPVVSYRTFPGTLLKAIPQKTGAVFFKRRYGYADQNRAMDELDAALLRGQVAALQTSAYFTTYFPPEMRFQFNAHNIIIYGVDNDTYLVSDPVFDTPQKILREDLRKARFARGLCAPMGLMHYPVSVPQTLDYHKLIRQSILSTAFMMFAPVPFIGIRGMRTLAKTIEELPRRRNPVYARHFLGNIVRMQEEIGTGGGGFRYLYASFLQEASQWFDNDAFKEAATIITQAGDLWRAFAYRCAKSVKNKEACNDFAGCADALRLCAEKEKAAFLLVRKALKK